MITLLRHTPLPARIIIIALLLALYVAFVYVLSGVDMQQTFDNIRSTAHDILAS